MPTRNAPFLSHSFKKKAARAINEIVGRGHVPIICGGTGFYIDALIYNTDFPAVPPNKRLRKKLQKETPQALAHTLRSLDPDRFETIDPHNKVRLIRAIEIATALGKVPKIKRLPRYDVTWHYLDFPDAVLKQRIHDRLMKRIKQGMVIEVLKLHHPPVGGGLSWKRLESLGLEYRFIARYLQNNLSKHDTLTQLETAIWRYAKRQRTWFKKYASQIKISLPDTPQK